LNKNAITLALLATVVAPAMAQSTVSVSGIADAGLRSVSNSGLASVRSMVSGANATSRLVIRGTEDLGNGNSAGFHLEHGLALTNGTAASSTQFWDRRSTVSLASKTAGELRLGRDFVPSYSNWSRYDPFSHVGAASAGNFVSATPTGPIRSAFGSNGNTTVRANSAFQYLLPGGLGGLEGGLMLTAAGARSAADGQNKVTGLRLGWAGGPMGVSAASTTTENDLTTSGRFTDRALGASYDLGMVRVSAVVRQFKQAGAKQTNQLIGAWIPVGQGEIKASWQRADLAGQVGATVIDANDARQIGLGYVHNLSRRTALYTTYSRITNSGASVRVVPGGTSGMAAGGTSKGFEAGVRHNF